MDPSNLRRVWSGLEPMIFPGFANNHLFWEENWDHLGPDWDNDRWPGHLRSCTGRAAEAMASAETSRMARDDVGSDSDGSGGWFGVGLG